MVLSYYYLAPVRKGALLAHHGRCCSLVKLLFIYFGDFNVIKHGEAVLNNIFFKKNYVPLERSPLDEAKNSMKPLKK